MAKSTPNRVSVTPGGKPEKPYPDFPLFPHATRRWAKKILGRLHYFGPWEDPQGSLDRYLREAPYLHAGRAVPLHVHEETDDRFRVLDAANAWLTAKKRALEAGEITDRTYAEYKATGELVVKAFTRTRPVEDLGPADFAKLRAQLAKQYGPTRLGNEVVRVRSLFKFAYENQFVPRPVPFGSEFKTPSRKVQRMLRARKPKKLFERHEVLVILSAAPMPLEAMILLGLNGGMGGDECGQLPIEAVDLVNGWIDYPRPKTGVQRRFPLWPETLEALAEAIGDRTAGPVFQTCFLNAWSGGLVSQRMGKLLDELGIRREGVGFYALRHTFQTIAEGCGDSVAVKSCMGHVDDSISDRYREEVPDRRLKLATDHVRNWLKGGEA